MTRRPLTTQAQLRNARHVDGLQFKCSHCKQVKPVQTSGGTGYGYIDDKPVCYECCGAADRASMLETGRATLYLTRTDGAYSVTNWPGTMRLAAGVKVGRHNIAGRRYDAWFTGPDGKPWHGVTYGDNTQICHCKRLKSA